MEHCQGFCKSNSRSYSLNNRKRKQSQNVQHKEQLIQMKSDHQYSVSIQKNHEIYYEDQLAMLRDYYHRQLRLKDCQILELQENVRELQKVNKYGKRSYEKQMMMTPTHKEQSIRDKSLSKETFTSLKKDLMKILKNQNEQSKAKFNSEQYQIRIKNLISFIKKYKQQCILAYKRQKQQFNSEKKQIISNLQRQKQVEITLRNKVMEQKSELDKKEEEVKSLKNIEKNLISELENYKASYQTLKTNFTSFKQSCQGKNYSPDEKNRNKFDTIAKRILSPNSQSEDQNQELLKTEHQELLMQKQALQLKLNMNINRCAQLNEMLAKRQIEIEDLKQRLYELQYQKRKSTNYQNSHIQLKNQTNNVCSCSAKQENKKLQEKIEQYQSLLKLEKEETASLKKRLQQKNLSESEQIKYIKQLQCENEALKQQIIVTKRELQICYAQQKKLQQQVKSKNIEIKNLLGKINQLQKNVQATLQESVAIKKQYMEILIERQEYIRALEDNSKNAENQIRQFQLKIQAIKNDMVIQLSEEKKIVQKNCQEKIVEIQQQFKIQQNRYQSQSHEQYLIMERAYNQTVALRQEVKKLNTHNERFQIEVQQLSLTLEIKNKQYSQLQSMIKKIKAGNEQKMTILQKQSSDANSQIKQLQNLLIDIQENLKTKQQQIKTLQQKLLCEKNFNSQLEKKNLKHEQVIEKKQQFLKNYQTEKRQMENKISKLQEKIQSLTFKNSEIEETFAQKQVQLQKNIQDKCSQFQQYKVVSQKRYSQCMKQQQMFKLSIKEKQQENNQIFKENLSIKQVIQQKQSQIKQNLQLQKEMQKELSQHIQQNQKLHIQWEQKQQRQKQNHQEQKVILLNTITQLEKKISSIEHQLKTEKEAQNLSEISHYSRVQKTSKTSKIRSVHYQQQIHLQKSREELERLRRELQKAKKIIQEYESKYPKLYQKYKSMRQKWYQSFKNIGQFNLDDYLIQSQSKSYVVEHFQEGETGKLKEIQIQQSIIIRSTNQQILIQQDATIETQLVSGRLRNAQMQQSIIYQEENQQTTTKKLISPQELAKIQIPLNIKRKLSNSQEAQNPNLENNQSIEKHEMQKISQDNEIENKDQQSNQKFEQKQNNDSAKIIQCEGTSNLSEVFQQQEQKKSVEQPIKQKEEAQSKEQQ